MRVEVLSKRDWLQLAESAYRISFDGTRGVDHDRIDYALLAVNEANVPMGFITCREHDAESVYWQFGGAFPGTEKSVHTLRAYLAGVEWTKAKYKRVWTLIENTNAPMLKLAAKVGFKITGVRNFKGSILVEHLLEFEGGS